MSIEIESGEEYVVHRVARLNEGSTDYFLVIKTTRKKSLIENCKKTGECKLKSSIKWMLETAMGGEDGSGWSVCKCLLFERRHRRFIVNRSAFIGCDAFVMNVAVILSWLACRAVGQWLNSVGLPFDEVVLLFAWIIKQQQVLWCLQPATKRCS